MAKKDEWMRTRTVDLWTAEPLNVDPRGHRKWINWWCGGITVHNTPTTSTSLLVLVVRRTTTTGNNISHPRNMESFPRHSPFICLSYTYARPLVHAIQASSFWPLSVCPSSSRRGELKEWIGKHMHWTTSDGHWWEIGPLMAICTGKYIKFLVVCGGQYVCVY